MIGLLLTTFLLFQPTAQSAAPAMPEPAQPVEVPREEARLHLLGDETSSLHVDLNRVAVNLNPVQVSALLFFSIKVGVVVDASGTVISAEASREPRGIKLAPDVYQQVESIVRGLHYDPFRRRGRPIIAKFDQYVSILPPEIQPSRHIPFPEVKDWKTVKITLQRSSCFGSCPDYRVEVHGDGSVVYVGANYVAFNGRHTGLVKQENVIDLVNLFAQADYYSLRDEYVASVTDCSTYTTALEIDGRRKQVVDYVGLHVGMPETVSRIENQIDRLSGSERWTHGNAETMTALEAENWNFKSAEAAATLLRVAQYGNAEIVRALALAGTPVENKNYQGLTALDVAAGRGDVAMLRALLDAGAGTSAQSLTHALIPAARSRNVETLGVLLRYGAQINSHDKDGRTPLMTAAASGSPSMVQEILKYHPDVNAALYPCDGECVAGDRNQAGRTALMEAASQYKYDVEPEGVNRPEVLRLLLKAGADPNARAVNGDTALILCRSRVDLALLLIQAGADVNARNHEGQTPLTNSSDDELKALLIKHGAVRVPANAEK